MGKAPLHSTGALWCGSVKMSLRNSNIVKIDGKGRILIPVHIRKLLDAHEGTDMVIIPDGDNSQVRILPLIEGKTAEFKFMILDTPGSLAQMASLLAENKLNIIMSESRALTKGKLAEWNVIVDTSQYSGKVEKLRDKLANSELVKSVEVVEG